MQAIKTACRYEKFVVILHRIREINCKTRMATDKKYESEQNYIIIPITYLYCMHKEDGY